MDRNIQAIVEQLRTLGTDHAEVEAKRSTGGLPESISSTICAFANRPGGGTILLGIDEASGFRSAPIDAPLLARQTADLVRQVLEPPPSVDIQIVEYEGHPVVVVDVSELAAGSKPCRVRAGRSQGVWIRAFDGDYRASELEAQALYASRIAPTHDRAVIPGAEREDLDTDAVEQFVRNRRSSSGRSTRVAALTSEEILHASSVLVKGMPSMSALLMLGKFPQRLVPGLHVRAVARFSDDESIRAEDAPRIEGSIPEMIAATVDWVHRMAPVAIRNGAAGRVVDEPFWPLDAVRELIGNALLHRDLSWSVNEPVLVTMTKDSLVIRNPGGLYGISVDELGRSDVTPARNATLVSIASHVRLPGGERTVEQLATGIPIILRSVSDRGYPPPRFVDDGIRFTVICRSTARRPLPVAPAAARLLIELGDETRTVEQLARQTGRSEQTVRRNLRDLADAGAVEVDGGRGRRTTYRRK